jgi:uncharacterized protein YjiS (DUF1127 family)
MNTRRGAAFLEQDTVARVATVRSARDRVLRAMWDNVFGALVAALRSGRKRRELISLSDRQLTDAGIDLTAAGRGKAAAARQDPNLEGSH